MSWLLRLTSTTSYYAQENMAGGVKPCKFVGESKSEKMSDEYLTGMKLTQISHKEVSVSLTFLPFLNISDTSENVKPLFTSKFFPFPPFSILLIYLFPFPLPYLATSVELLRTFPSKWFLEVKCTFINIDEKHWFPIWLPGVTPKKPVRQCASREAAREADSDTGWWWLSYWESLCLGKPKIVSLFPKENFSELLSCENTKALTLCSEAGLKHF